MEEASGHSFLVLGSQGQQGSEHQRRVAAGMAEVARRLHCRFVLTTGDNFGEVGVAGPDDPRWDASFEHVYLQASLAVPWYVTLGDGDHRGDVRAQIERTWRCRRWNLPAAYYTFRIQVDEEIAQLVVLDTTSLVREDPCGELQWSWLRRTLARAEGRWTFVVGHHPVCSASPHHGDDRVLQARLRPLLEEHGVTAYLSGHEHDLQHLVAGGVHYLVSGAGACCRESGVDDRSTFAMCTTGFLAVTLSEADVRFRFFDAEGAELFGLDTRTLGV